MTTPPPRPLCPDSRRPPWPERRPQRLRRAGAAAVLLGVLVGGSVAQGVLIGRVVRVHDGDSVTLQQGDRRVTLRLAAVDAPELAQPHGEEARKALHACAFGRPVMVRAQGPDRHGRVVGQLESGGRDCALVLIEAGLAWHYKAYEREQPLADRAAYAAAERNARRRGIGLWSEPSPQPPWDYRREHPPGEGWLR